MRFTPYRWTFVALLAALALVAGGCVFPTPPPGAPVPKFTLTLSTAQPVVGTFNVTAQPVNFTPRRVEFRVDKPDVPGVVDTTSPYQITLDAAKLSRGPHTVYALGSDGTYSVVDTINFDSAGRPNVVFLMTDDMRYDEFDQLADLKPGGGFDWVRKNGVRFPMLWMTDNLCCPGRATALTGQTAYNNGVFDNTKFKDLRNTLPVWLQQEGYCTGLVGKYLNGYSAASPRPPGWNFWEPLLTKEADEFNYTMMRRDGSSYAPGVYQTTQLGALSRAQLNDCFNSGKPAFVALWPSAPHFETVPEAKYANFPVSWTNHDPSFEEADISDKPAWLQKWFPTVRSDADAFYRTIHVNRMRTLLSVDDALKDEINLLQLRGQLRNTLFVLTSDNGFLLGEHRVNSRKRLAYEAAQVAAWVAGPDFPAGVTSDAFAMNLDLAPSILRASGAADYAKTDGRTLQGIRVFTGHGHDRFLPLYVPVEEGETNVQPVGEGVRTWRYKYIHYADGSEELYDLSTDPHELTNKASASAYQTVKSQMALLLAKAKTCRVATCQGSAPVSLQH